jgi:hypothetical protein
MFEALHIPYAEINTSLSSTRQSSLLRTPTCRKSTVVPIVPSRLPNNPDCAYPEPLNLLIPNVQEFTLLFQEYFEYFVSLLLRDGGNR